MANNGTKVSKYQGVPQDMARMLRLRDAARKLSQGREDLAAILAPVDRAITRAVNAEWKRIGALAKTASEA